jgi:hypothetical protein
MFIFYRCILKKLIVLRLKFNNLLPDYTFKLDVPCSFVLEPSPLHDGRFRKKSVIFEMSIGFRGEGKKTERWLILF